MYFLLGSSHMERSDYESAIQSFERAQAQMRHYEGRSLLVVSLVGLPMGVLQCIEIAHQFGQIFGWKFDNLDFTVRQRLCEALYAVGRTLKDAGQSFLELVDTLNEEVYMSGPITKWISGECTFTCLIASFKFFCQILATVASPLPKATMVQPRRQNGTMMCRHLLQSSTQALPHCY